jgi:3alpha(or 20beta)-hydroxysteroid dehydrogenase
MITSSLLAKRVDCLMMTKTVLITGASSGFGKACAQRFAQSGYRLILLARRADRLEELVAQLAAQCEVCVLAVDITDTPALEHSLNSLNKPFNNVDILINNAGVVGFTPLDTCDLDEWNRVIGINLTGTFLGIRYVADSMKRAGGGVIVNMSSTAGLMGYSQLGAYVASKWGVRGLTKSAALDLAQYKIRVVSVHPGPIETPMTAGLDVSFSRRPIPRIGQPSEVAAMILFLVADATFSTGTEFVLDGGATIGEMKRT